MNRNLARGLFLVVISIAFGAGALRYPVESLARPGPGLFPLLVSSILFVLGVVTILQSRSAAFAPLAFDVKNIALIMAALVGFVALSTYLNMIAAIVFLVFVASYAGVAPSWQRSVSVAIGLVVIAFLFQYFFGLNLRLV